MPIEEQKKSRLYALKPLTDRLPAVNRPEGHVHFRTKMLWVLVILVLYFAMTNIFIYGLDRTNGTAFFSSLRAILAGAQGSHFHWSRRSSSWCMVWRACPRALHPATANLRDDED